MIMPGWQSPVLGHPSRWDGAADAPPRITVDGLLFATSLQDLDGMAGALIMAKDLAGWDDSPPDATEQTDHWSGDGVLSGLPGLGARKIVLSGLVAGETVAAVSEAKDLIARTPRGILVVDERSRFTGREATIRKVSLTWTRVSDFYETFALAMQADDPLRYLTATHPLVNGTNVLLNPGNREAWPTIELTGPHSAISIVHPGGTWTLTATAAGVERVVDLREGEVWEGGVRVHGHESGPAPSVPAGGTSWTVSGVGSGGARVRRFGAWS